MFFYPLIRNTHKSQLAIYEVSHDTRPPYILNLVFCRLTFGMNAAISNKKAF